MKKFYGVFQRDFNGNRFSWKSGSSLVIYDSGDEEKMYSIEGLYDDDESGKDYTFANANDVLRYYRDIVVGSIIFSYGDDNVY